DWRHQYNFRLSEHGAPAAVGAGLNDLAIANVSALDPKHTYQVSATVKNDSFSFVQDGKEILKGPIPPSNTQTVRMAYLKLAYSTGRFDNVRIIGALDAAQHEVVF